MIWPNIWNSRNFLSANVKKNNTNKYINLFILIRLKIKKIKKIGINNIAVCFDKSPNMTPIDERVMFSFFIPISKRKLEKKKRRSDKALGAKR